MDLTNASNAQVADTFEFLHRRNKKSAVKNGGTPKIDAQVLAVALAVYATGENLTGLNYNATGGPGAPLYDFTDVNNNGTFDLGDGDAAILSSANISHVQSFGFNTSQDGIAYQRFNVLSVSEANDLGIVLDADGHATIIDILLSTNALANFGLLYGKWLIILFWEEKTIAFAMMRLCSFLRTLFVVTYKSKKHTRLSGGRTNNLHARWK